MSRPIVLDSSTLLTLLERQEGWEDVVDLFLEALEGDRPLLMNMASWGEMLNMAGRTYPDYARAERVLRSIEWLPIRIGDGGRASERRAALLFRDARLSYAASQTAARAMEENAELATGDPEFRRIENEVKIRWIGRAGVESYLQNG